MASWLSAFPDDLDWLREARERHVALASEWADAIQSIDDVRWRHAEAERRFRGVVRDALTAGDPAPVRPPEIDVAQRDAEVSIAAEDADAVRDELNRHVVEVLAVLRENRSELDDEVLEGLPITLLRSLTVGGANRRRLLVEAARRDLAHLEEPAIEIFDGGPSSTPDLDTAAAA
jgi:hypothetical protein